MSGLIGAVEKRLREEMAKLRVEINEEKSRKVDLSKGGSFGFLGFEYRRIRSRKRKWRAPYERKTEILPGPPPKIQENLHGCLRQPVAGESGAIHSHLYGCGG